MTFDLVQMIEALEDRRMTWVGDGSQPDPLCTQAAAEIIRLTARVAALEGTEPCKAVRDVIAERARQIAVEGWTPNHDNIHIRGDLICAAVSYLFAVINPNASQKWWPARWSLNWWKPTTPRRNLVKAAALIIAEIERLDRAALVGVK